MTVKETERKRAIEWLKERIKAGDTIYTHVEHVSRSGMYRAIRVYRMDENKPVDISSMVAKAIDARFDKNHYAVGVGGCGMDMGFAVVYDLSYRLFPEGYTCTGKKCYSNDHTNGDRNYRRHHHTDGGYAIQQRWL